MGYTTSGSKIDARKAKRASFVNSLNYKQVYVPWDIEAFRAKGSAAKGQTFNQTQGSTYEKYILNSLRSGIKGTTSLGAPFALPARPDAINGNLLKGKINSRIDGYSLSAGEMYEMKSGDKGDTLAGLQNKFIQGLKNNPEILNPKRKWKNYIFRTTKAKGRGASNGFIPNLAYKGEVMDLEESISGEKAIYSNTPFPHVRNASQPTFASAIADHGGLSNALKDSYGNQSAAGMVYGGFVPNFADNERAGVSIGKLNLEKLQTQVGNTTKNLIDLSDEFQLAEMFASDIAKDLKSGSIGSETAKKKITELGKNLGMTNKQTQKLEKNIRKASKTSLGSRFGAGSGAALAFAGPMAAGLLEQTFFGDRQRSDMSGGERVGQSVLSTGLTSVSTGIAIGDSLNIPFGGLLGGIAGAGLGVVSAFNSVELSAEELAQVNEKLSQKNNESVSTASSYISAQKKLNSLIQSGAADAEIQQASKSLRDSFRDIKDVNLQRSFADAGSDVGKMTEKLSSFSTAFAKTQAVRNLGAIDVFEKSQGFAAGLRGGTTANEASTAFANLDKNAVSSLLLTSGLDLKPLQKLAREGGTRYSKLTSNLSLKGREARGPLGVVKEGFEEDISNELTSILTDSGLSEQADDFKAAYKFFVNFLFGPDAFGIIKDLDKDNKTFDLTDKVRSFLAVSSRSFNKIFRGINDDFETLSSSTLRQIENESSAQKIQSTILDFTSSFSDQISSFVSNNLPDLEKFQFAQSAATQKANNQLAKLNQDYAAFEQNQNTARAQALQNNAKDLTKVFEDSLFRSEQVGNIFKDQILKQLNSGDYQINLDEITKKSAQDAVESYNKEFRNEQFGGIQNPLFALGEGSPPDFDINQFTDEQRKEIFNAEKSRIEKELKKNLESDEGGDEDRAAKQLAALEQLQKEINLITTDAKRDELKSVLESKKNELELFDLKQRNAKREQEINDQFLKQRIEAEKTLAVEKNKIDAQNLARTRAAEIASTRLGFAGDIAGATGESRMSAIQRGLSDPRQTFGMGLQEITERRIAAERDILEERRAIENNQLQIEMRQSLLSLNAEVENTKALNELNSNVLRLIGVQLSGDEDVARIKRDVNYGNVLRGGLPMSNEDIRGKYGDQAANKYFTLQGINQMQASSGSGSTELNKQLSKNSDLSFDSLRNTAKGNEELTQQINLLEEQYNTRLKILGIQRDATNDDIKQQNELDRINNTLSGRFQKGVGGMERQSQEILLNLAETAPSRFADGMANALNEVANGTKDIGDAFSDMAIDFGRMLQQEVFRALAQKAVGNLLSGFTTGQTGGSMSQGAIKAQNGMYISGGRTGDRNLALLEDGEYVLNRNAVRGMGGSKALDKLNFGMAPRFQSGGYNMYADQALKNNEYDFTGGLMFNGSNAGDVNPDLYSAYAFENSPYFQRQKEIANEKLQRKIRKRFEKKQKKAQRTGAIINMVGSIAAAGAASAISSAQSAGAAARSAGSSLQSTADGGNAALAKAAQGSDYSFGRYIQRNSSSLTLNGQTLNQLASSKMISGLRSTVVDYDSAVNVENKISSASFQRQMADPFGGGMFNRDRVKISSVFNDAGFTAQASNKPGLLKAMFSGARGFFGKGKRQEGGSINYNSGGFVPHGSRLSDTIPAMLTGGEYVMNNKAVAKYGLGTMNAMNAGGLSTSSTTNNSTNNNATSISVSVDRSGKSEYGAQTTSYNKDDIVISKEMAQQINALVLKRVVDEKRYGGELYKNPLRT